MLYADYLEHHGVKGMKWGVRRYQNYDGSYTKKGLKRFNESMDSYERANAKYQTKKAAYKEAKKGTSSLSKIGHKIAAKAYELNEKTYAKSNKALSNLNKAAKEKHLNAINEINARQEAVKTAKGDYKIAKTSRNFAKKKLNRDYDQLAKDKLADQGKELYSEGKTITNNTTMQKLTAVGAGFTMGAGKAIYNYGFRDLGKKTVLVGAGMAAANAILKGKNAYENKRLRAYYAHSRKQPI